MSGTCYNCFQPLPEGAGVCPACGYDAAKDQGKYPMALPGGTVLNGRYILGRVLGQGGFGITYVAQDHKTGELVAVKEYFPDTMATRSQVYTVTAYTGQREENFTYGKECFLNEAKTLAEFIGNPNIVRVYSYFEENNTAYFVMEYVRGTSFQEYLKDRGSIPWQEAKWILFPVMEALAAVHGKGIVHRDVTPDNIYITKDGKVKLLDFGAARYSLGDKSRSLDVVLKHGFAPKEQYSRHGRQGPFTDVYALGATFYFAITGRIPPDSIDRQDEDDLILPSSLGVKIPPGVEDALCKALAVSPQDRFQSMGEFQLALRQGENSDQTGTSGSQPYPPNGEAGGTSSPQPYPPGDEHQPPGQGGPKKKAHPKWYALIGVCAVAFLCLTVYIFSSREGGNPNVAVSSPADSLSSSGEESSSSSPLAAQAAGPLEETLSATEKISLPVRETYYDETGAIEDYEQYEYDDWGNELRHIYFLADGSVDYYIQSVYDTQGNETASYHCDGSGAPKSWDESTYDENGHQLTSVSYDDDGSVRWSYEYEYDEAGNQVKSLAYDEENSLSGWYEYEYDSLGNEVERRDYDENGSLEGMARREYDQAGNQVLFQYYDGNEKLDSWTEYEYDAQGNEIASTGYEADGTLSSWSETKYDSQGYSVSHTWSYSPEDQDDYNIFIYQNDYDGEGNILRRTCYSDGELWYVEEYQVREISAVPGGDPSLSSGLTLDLPTPEPAGSASDPEETGEFTGSSHGLQGVEFAIDAIRSKEGFADRYSGFPCGGLVEINGGPWFLALYELETEDMGYAVYYSLYDLRGNGLVEPAFGQLFVPVGGNNGKVGIAQDKEGICYFVSESSMVNGTTSTISRAYLPFEEDGPVTDGMYSVYMEIDHDNDTEVYAVGGAQMDKESFEEFEDQFTTVCSMDLFGNYVGNVITFEDFVQNYE